MDDSDNERMLAQELRDERARRREAEHRLEELTGRAELWRQRAEERTARIERLLAAQRRKGSTLRRWARALTGDRDRVQELVSVDESSSTGASFGERVTRPWPSLKSVVIVSAVSDPGMSRALSVFDERPLATASETDLDRADFVVVDVSALRSIDPKPVERLAEWSRGPGRQPMITWDGDDDPARTLSQQPGDTTIAYEKERADRLGVPWLPGCLDPARHRPGPGGVIDDFMPEAASPKWPTLAVIERAASGIGFEATPGAGTAARRWAYRHHAPWVRAGQLLDLVGLSARSALPGVAVILVSHRPADLPTAIAAVLRQTHRPAELVVGVHGDEVTAEIRSTVEQADIPVTLLSLAGDLTLGECLNRAAEVTTSPLLAKFDDDDHYGPAHLEDSFHSLAYSGADVVGKGTHFTFMADSEATVLRRPGLEETFLEGSPNGATLVFHREVWDRVGFPHRPRHVDTGFLRGVRATGATVYAGSRWEFCYVRRGRGHTWDAEDEVFTAGSEPAWDGFHPDRVEVPDVDLT